MNSEISDFPAITQFSKSQRRVIGVLLEKAFTTPDSYPLTLKALTTGCNQKSNRDPVTNYSEDAVLDVVDELRKIGAVAVVHTETGRSERYRHYMRKRFKFSEKQLAILTELFLRGRQTLGELRARAGRMVPIDSLEILRSELNFLKQDGFLQASGSLEKRGIEVDHHFYSENEKNRNFTPMTESDSDPEEVVPETSSSPVNSSVEKINFQEEMNQLKEENENLRKDLQELKNQLEQLQNEFHQFKTELGG
jgi:uncharacterized protein